MECREEGVEVSPLDMVFDKNAACWVLDGSQQQESKMEWRKVWTVLHAVEVLKLDREVAVAELKKLGMNWLRAHYAVSETIKKGYSPRRDL